MLLCYPLRELHHSSEEHNLYQHTSWKMMLKKMQLLKTIEKDLWEVICSQTAFIQFQSWFEIPGKKEPIRLKCRFMSIQNKSCQLNIDIFLSFPYCVIAQISFMSGVMSGVTNRQSGVTNRHSVSFTGVIFLGSVGNQGLIAFLWVWVYL